jgi:hypothetical protein
MVCLMGPVVEAGWVDRGFAHQKDVAFQAVGFHEGCH